VGFGVEADRVLILWTIPSIMCVDAEHYDNLQGYLENYPLDCIPEDAWRMQVTCASRPRPTRAEKRTSELRTTEGVCMHMPTYEALICRVITTINRVGIGMGFELDGELQDAK
jgi:hypothetical protein